MANSDNNNIAGALQLPEKEQAFGKQQADREDHRQLAE